MTEPNELISVVIPAYKSEDILPHLYERLTETLGGMGMPYEIVVVCDCSPDNTWQRLTEIAEKDWHVKAILLRRNFGCNGALMAGLSAAKGDLIITMDDDLQHAPEDIPALVGEIRKGYDIVFANFPIKKQTVLKNFGSWLNGILGQVVLKKPKGLYLSPFKIMRRDVVREILPYVGPYPYVDGLLLLTTSAISQIDVEHHDRFTGEGNYTLIPSLRIWFNHATTFSVYPLRVTSLMGTALSFVSVCIACFLVVWRLSGGDAPEGWATTLLAITFIGGIQLLALGVLGEYLGRAYLTINHRPQYVVRETRNLSPEGKES